jgi:hypothetical protein
MDNAWLMQQREEVKPFVVIDGKEHKQYDECCLMLKVEVNKLRHV